MDAILLTSLDKRRPLPAYSPFARPLNETVIRIFLFSSVSNRSFDFVAFIRRLQSFLLCHPFPFRAEKTERTCMYSSDRLSGKAMRGASRTHTIRTQSAPTKNPLHFGHTTINHVARFMQSICNHSKIIIHFRCCRCRLSAALNHLISEIIE